MQRVAAEFSESEMQRREPVWRALSEFWLDTELSEEDLRRIAETLARSGYSLDELETIYVDEVAPVVFLNLYSVAGIWEGFDLGWLRSEIIRMGRGKRFLFRFLRGIGIAKPVMTWTANRHWSKVVQILKNERGIPCT